MKIVAVILNIVLFGFICLVSATDGPPQEASSIVFMIWWLLTLILSAVVISRSGASRIKRNVAIICNIVFLGFIGWAFVDQYPHPNEPGFIPFVILMVLTPILNLVVLFLRRARDGQPTKTA
jgi:cytochrome bd-type quinol oxidase subunit 2